MCICNNIYIGPNSALQYQTSNANISLYLTIDTLRPDPHNVDRQLAGRFRIRSVQHLRRDVSPDTRSKRFHSLTKIRYKIVSGHEIKAAVLFPKDLKPGLHPVIVNVHGGFFSTAHSLFAPFFAPWALKLALDHGAIIVSADYRLLPTPNGIADQLEDLEDFWQWYRSSLPSILQRNAAGYEVDYKRALLVGGSAGGYYAAQLAMSHANDISALALAYPAVDLRDGIWNYGPAENAPTVLRFPADEMPSRDEALAWVAEKRKTVASKGGFERTPFLVALTQHGLFGQEMFEYGGVKLRTEELPLERLKAGAKLPKAV
jgi:pimeloyl-ACP methyl ester carboxylesterase